jgi:hypothetical protein
MRQEFKKKALLLARILIMNDQSSPNDSSPTDEYKSPDKFSFKNNFQGLSWQY